MPLPKEGYAFTYAPLIFLLIIIDSDGKLHTFINPGNDSLYEICHEYNLPLLYTKEIVDGAKRGMNTLMIDRDSFVADWQVNHGPNAATL